MSARARVPLAHRWVFWDVDPRRLDVRRDAGYIIPRVLEFGGMAQVRWVIRAYGMRGIHRFLREVGHPELSNKTIRFWRVALHAEKERWATPPASLERSSAPWVA